MPLPVHHSFEPATVPQVPHYLRIVYHLHHLNLPLVDVMQVQHCPVVVDVMQVQHCPAVVDVMQVQHCPQVLAEQHDHEIPSMLAFAL
jgi:xanthine dehydrogenase molybdopterin-binding subunit B